MASVELIVALVSAVLVLSVALWWQSRRPARVMRRRSRQGQKGEARAEKMLTAAGYTIIDSQAEGQLSVRVDGVITPFTVRADYLAQRRGRSYVVEVKTGKVAPELSHAATRRQLLEYKLVFDPDALLLVDATKGSIREIEFLDLSKTRRLTWWWIVPVVLALWAVLYFR